MDAVYMNALLVAIIFFAIKMVENKFQKDENEIKPLKQIVKDTLVVYVCCISGSMIYKQFFPSVADTRTTSAFVNNPDF